MGVQALAAALAIQAPGAAAQELRARLLDAVSRQPLGGVYATLEAVAPASGERGPSALSDNTGWVRIRAPEPGRYRLRLERPGYENHATPEFVLDSSVVREFLVPARPIELPALTARGRRQCGRMADAAAATLWEEIRKALAVSSWTARESSTRYVVREYRQRLDVRTHEVLEERNSNEVVRTVGSPFASLGARDLAERGFIRTAAGGGYEYYGPDSDVILSDWFRDRHCFRTLAGDDPTLVGLAFEPGPGAPTFDIAGVLWLDRSSLAFHYLEYHYSRLPTGLDSREAGGEVHFERLADGRWIVRSWWIRAPVAGEAAPGARPSVVALEQAGRTVLSLMPDGADADH